MLNIERAIQTRHQFPEPNKSEPADAAGQSSPDAVFDPEAYFDRWFDDVHAIGKQLFPETSQTQEFFVESQRGSNGEVTFEGVLHLDGYTLGDIRSPDGTLVIGKKGRVDADIDVARAVICGSVIGNICASEGVILEGDARVAGHIYTRMLSVRVGALFEGDCMFAAIPEASVIKESSGNKRQHKRTPAPNAPSLASEHTSNGLLIDQHPLLRDPAPRARAASSGKS